MPSSNLDPVKKLPYIVDNDINGGQLLIYGNPNASNVAICCAGYADDHSVFQSFASRLAKESDCMVGVMCLPGFDDRLEKPWTSHKKGGYSFDEMAASVREAVKVLRGESTFKKENGEVGAAQLIGIFHDWGVYPGTTWANRSIEEGVEGLKPDKMVYFDVLPFSRPTGNGKLQQPDLSIYEWVIHSAYKIVVAVAFLLQQYLSKFLAMICFNLGFFLLSSFKLTPSYHIADDTATMKSIHTKGVQRCIYMAYPYINFFQAIINDTMAKDEFFLMKDLVKTPILYMYGKEKRIQFNMDKKGLEILEIEEREGRKSKAIPVEDAGHWFYLNQEDICVKAVISFIEDKE